MAQSCLRPRGLGGRSFGVGREGKSPPVRISTPPWLDTSPSKPSCVFLFPLSSTFRDKLLGSQGKMPVLAAQLSRIRLPWQSFTRDKPTLLTHRPRAPPAGPTGTGHTPTLRPAGLGSADTLVRSSAPQTLLSPTSSPFSARSKTSVPSAASPPDPSSS